MADGVEFNITGLEGVLEKLRTLGPRLQKNGLRKAARRAMNIVRDAAREKARLVDDPETPEKIWKNIITQESAKQGRREGGGGDEGWSARRRWSKPVQQGCKRKSWWRHQALALSGVRHQVLAGEAIHAACSVSKH